jgi:alanyl-tRNA synthetase
MTLGDHVGQKGSNITVERLRFDFSHPQKVTPEELAKVEEIVNEQIKKDIPVSFTVSTYDEAVKGGATAFFGERYPEKVKVYSIGSFSKEICGGPHVEHTGMLGHFKIIKEESAGAGIRRIYAVVESSK